MTAKTPAPEKKLVAMKNFTDAGTGRSFEQGNPVDVDEGTLGNYVAAGLVGTETAAQQLVDESHANVG